MIQNFTMFAGDSKILRVTVTDSGGPAVDLTGSKIKWALKESSHVPNNEVAKDTIIGGISIPDPQNGVFEVKILPGDTVDLEPGYYYQEAEVTDAEGNVSTVFSGTVTIQRSGV